MPIKTTLAEILYNPDLPCPLSSSLFNHYSRVAYGYLKQYLTNILFLQCTSKVSTCPTKDLRESTTQTSLWSRSKVLPPQKTLSSTWVSVLPTFTEPPRKLEVPRSELSGVRSPELTVTPVSLELSSDLTCQLRLSVLPLESSCTHLTSKHVAV